MLSSLRKPRTYVKFTAGIAHHIACVAAATAAIDMVVDPKTESAEDNVEDVGFIVGSMIWYRTDHMVKNVIDAAADRRLAHKAAKQNAEAVA